MTAARFRFESDATGGDRLSVVGFSGQQRLSRLYRYLIEVRVAMESVPVIDELLRSPARLITELYGDEFTVHGVLAHVEELRTVHHYVYYSLELVPRLWYLSQYRTNEIYTEETTVEQIIDLVLGNAGLAAGTDYELAGLDSAHFIQRDYRCQFGETDFDFLSRLMENEGIFYYFDHSGDCEKIVFANTLNYPQLARPGLFYDVSAQARSQHDSIHAWSCRMQSLPGGVRVKDYNPQHPSLDISSEVSLEQTGIGTEYVYGENIIDESEADILSQIRAEERLCHKTRYYGESSAVLMQAGYSFEFDQHPNTVYNGVSYLCLEVNHEARVAELSITSQGAADASPQYANSFVALAASEQFRPDRVTAKTHFYGTMNAFIHAETGNNQAEIDEQGRYRVHVPFDRVTGARDSSDLNRKTSAWIRMAQSYVGEKRGAYYPLTGGTEVLLSFINGDPDQPVIVGALPNALEPALLTSDNEHESTIQTGSGNRIRMGDAPGEDRIVLESPTDESSLRIGTVDSNLASDANASSGIRLDTRGDYELDARGDNRFKSNGDSTIEVGSDLYMSAQGDSIKFQLADNKVVLDTGNRDFEITCKHFTLENTFEDNITDGHDYAKHLGTATEEFYGASNAHYFGEAFETYIGAKQELCLANVTEVFVGLKQEAALSATVGVFFGAAAEAYFGAKAEVQFGAKAEAFFGAEAEYSASPKAKKETLEAQQLDARIEALGIQIDNVEAGVEKMAVLVGSIAIDLGNSEIAIKASKLTMLT